MDICEVGTIVDIFIIQRDMDTLNLIRRLNTVFIDVINKKLPFLIKTMFYNQKPFENSILTFIDIYNKYLTYIYGIRLVIQQTGCNKETAILALNHNDDDVVNSIMYLTII